jgi:signal peptidase II
MSMAKSITRYLVFLMLVVSIGGCDRISKDIATDTLAGSPTQSFLFDTVRLTYAENPGAFLSLGAGLSESLRFAIFTIGIGLFLAALIVYAFRSRWHGLKFFGFSLFVAGGIANWADRMTDGLVVDFLNVGVGPIRTGIFNVADMSLLAGVVILIVGDFWQGRKQRHG